MPPLFAVCLEALTLHGYRCLGPLLACLTFKRSPKGGNPFSVWQACLHVSVHLLNPPLHRLLQRVPIKGTPLKIAHYAEAGLFAVLSSRQVRWLAGWLAGWCC